MKNYLLIALLFSLQPILAQTGSMVRQGTWRGEIYSIGGKLPINFVVGEGNKDKIPNTNTKWC